MSEWTPRIVRFMDDAALRGRYYQRLCEIVLRGLPGGSLVCDAGCGIGHLSLEMVRAGMSVYAVDRSAEAVAQTAARLARPPYGCSRVEKADFLDPGSLMPGVDRMVFSLSARAGDAYEVARRAGAKSLVVVNKMHESHQVDRLDRPIVYNLEQATGELCSMGLVTHASDVTLDLSQPMRSLAEAREYFGLFRNRKYPNGVTTAQLLDELEETGDEEFPYVLPVCRRLAVFRIQMEAAGSLGIVGSRRAAEVFGRCLGIPAGMQRRAS